MEKKPYDKKTNTYTTKEKNGDKIQKQHEQNNILKTSNGFLNIDRTRKQNRKVSLLQKGIQVVQKRHIGKKK